MLVVTMTTLGFGDVVPKATLARAFVGFASVLGIFLMALFISVVHETLQLKQQEKRILACMENAGTLLSISSSHCEQSLAIRERRHARKAQKIGFSRRNDNRPTEGSIRTNLGRQKQ